MDIRRGLLFFAAALLLSVLPIGFVFAGGCLMVARKYLDRGFYIISVLFVSALLIPNLTPEYWAGFIAMALMAGLFVEAKVQHSSDMRAGLISILSTCGFLSIGTGIWIQTKNLDLVAGLRTKVDAYLSNLPAGVGASIEVDTLIAQFPSAIVGAMVLSLCLALMAESFIIRRAWAPESFLSYGGLTRESLLNFRLPEWTIWPLLGCVLFAFVDLKIPLARGLGQNLFNVFAVVYLLQGFAVIASFFKDHQVSIFWQIAWYFLFMQMYFVVSLIGFLDYWFDFRNRFMSSGHEVKIKK